ncbi:hormogonium polysaccharide biosynthesis protein HpsA [Chroococcidiopsis sp. TS-821]|uniref:hormogonium polysaccharide biosynthesis protein HpsA n=1 Tax=Chroococcidiopsis sp. TS-821 TaxID=1378066 RepID=UPI000CEE8021|nr:hormogonium polysaccharide biosynthesis protein HpsA [Chroococcidiopsis sp. TS-821]PPS44731.1 hypothetical protein B1A85_00070 [Chroococcidiopsis sp. TS-821]
MVKRKFIKMPIRILQKFVNFILLTKRKLYWLLRRSSSRRRRNLQSGFVLPTTAMLLLVVTLVTGAILTRSLNRTTQVVGNYQAKEIYNAASPAIDRAKAKLEALFADTRLPNGVPGQAVLQSMMLNDGSNGVAVQTDSNGKVNDKYTLPGEKRLDINGDKKLDNAWSYQIDSNGDGKLDGKDSTIAYSIILESPEQDKLEDQSDTAIKDKAKNLKTRNGPFSATQANQACRQLEANSGSTAVEQGWFNVNAATLRKNFQVNAVVIPGENQRATAALEFQQDRQLDRGNKWGGWFRGDLEIFPGPSFNWNGALHTEGSLFVGGNQVTAYLISSPSSCLYTRDASEITVTQVVNPENNATTFQGQIVNGTIRDNNFNGSSVFHLFNGAGTAPITSGSNPNVTLNGTTHSVVTGGNRTPIQISLDPIALYTQDESKARNTTDPTNTSVRRSAWNTSSFVEHRRIFNQQEPKPYVDDTYRADNRYGPRPNYGRDTRLTIPVGKKIGDAIDNTIGAEAFDDLTKDNPKSNNPEDLGLDGYWERRARREGLRIIVGQRLELANPLGQPTTNITHEARQRRALRDNLAAVQASAIYHYKYPDRNINANSPTPHSSGYLPVACLATTAHPGTATTINNSTTFNTVTINGNSRINTDFLTGNGTNGWEFNPPAGVTTDAAFANAIAAGQPLRKALTNLAYFAGDPFGAFPARQDTTASPAVPSAGRQIHPHPVLTQWGNFSELRRVVALLDSGTTYANLSLADKTTLHTASCMMGMLAYNLQNIEDAYREIADDTSGATSTNALGVQLSQLMDGVASPGNPEIGRPADGTNICTSTGGANCPSNTYNPSYYANFTAEEWINALDNSPGLGANKAELLRKARIIFARQQILRDRTFGFQLSSNAFLGGIGVGNGYNAQTGIYTIQHINAGQFSPGQQFRVSCDPNSFLVNGSGNANGLERARLGLTMAFCSQAEQPKYPSLFYLFPVSEHDHLGVASPTALAANPRATVIQPTSEPYVANAYIFNPNPLVTDDVNHNRFYKVIGDTNGNGIENGTEDSIAAIALQPKARTNWLLPNTTTTSGRINIIRDNGTSVGIPFLDKGMFNGREMISVRVLDIDLDQLRRNTIRGVTDDAWLPKGGIVYAFREDAVREDGIARPAGPANSLMNANTPQDPPITSANGITTKPVDYYADPDRRPHGFRLRNGTDLRRVNSSNNSFTIPDDENIRGISFISDNPVYIQGDFNLHQLVNTNTRLEEFSQLLQDNYSNFYSRSTLDARFARPNTDTWRPTEILADAVTILSNNFCDGSIEDGFVTAGTSSGATVPLAQYGCGTGNGRTSYLNQNRPRDSLTSTQYWLRENDDSTSPIRVSPNGNPEYCEVNTSPCPSSNRREYNSTRYYPFSEAKSRNDSSNNMRVNAIIISGIVPSQAQQSYGGLHNFPRFLENWNGRNLYISGAFLQLNFSTYATGPFDQDAWETNQNPQAAELIQYYNAPNRRWGYDVGLQYAPAGPVSRRFVTASGTRSEFYRELKIDDPYIQQLRNAVKK